MNIIKFIKKIEKSSYPEEYRQMQNCNVLQDIIEYCEAKDEDDLVLEYGKSWYFLAVKSTGEIVDLAGKTELSELIKIRRIIRKEFKNRTITIDAREETSYRLVSRLGKVIYDQPYSWSGEVFHEMIINIC